MHPIVSSCDLASQASLHWLTAAFVFFIFNHTLLQCVLWAVTLRPTATRSWTIVEERRGSGNAWRGSGWPWRRDRGGSPRRRPGRPLAPTRSVRWTGRWRCSPTTGWSGPGSGSPRLPLKSQCQQKYFAVFTC